MARAIPANTGNLSKFTQKKYDDVLFDSYTRYPEEFPSFCNVSTWNEGSMQEFEAATLGAFAEQSEGNNVSLDGYEELNGKEIFFPVYSQGFVITEVLKEDDRTGKLNSIPKEMGKAAAYTRDLEAADLLNTSFVSTYRTGMDGVALFSASHPLDGDSLAGSTYSNLVSGALSADTLQDALDKCNKMVNYRGIPVISIPEKLIIHPDLVWKAKELLLSPSKPYTSDNEINVLQNEVTYSVNHYLTSSTAWFIQCKYHDLRFVWRRVLKSRMQEEYGTGNSLYRASMRFAANFFDWRGMVGSTGL